VLLLVLVLMMTGLRCLTAQQLRALLLLLPVAAALLLLLLLLPRPGRQLP
jgi:hypothetical protein